MRKFEKISIEQLKKDINEEIGEYNLPVRSTKFSAGYDFEILMDLSLNPGDIKKLPTGIKCQMNDNEVLLLIIRSSLGFKYNLRLTNQVAVIDKDYYNNVNNEGHIWLSIINEGNKPVNLKKGDKIVQGIFTNYLTVDDELEVENIRDGWTVMKEEK